MLENVLFNIAKEHKFVLVLDAVDESEDVKAVISFLLHLRALSVEVFFTNRPDLSIRRAWDSHTTETQEKCLELTISAAFVSRDIKWYVSNTLDSLISSKELSFNDSNLRLEIISTLTNRSDGM